MRQFLRRLPSTVEFATVIAGAFGLFIVESVRQAVLPTTTIYTEGRLWHVLIYELPVMAVLLLILKFRGWTLAGMGLRPALSDPLIGIGLAIASYVAFYATLWSVWFAALTFRWPLPMASISLQHCIPLATAIAVSLVNPIFEELFVCGYIVSALERARWRSWSAINVSVAVRLAYHLYQGIIGVVTSVPVGLIFALWYSRNRRLWPLIVAHGVIDFIALARA